MVFCSGCIFLTIAASFFTVSSFDRPVHLLLNFCKRSLLVMGFLVRYLLTASSVIPWGPSSLPVGVGVLVLEPPPAPPAEGAGDTRGFLLAGLPSSPGVPFLLALAGRFFDFATKTQTIQKIVSARGTWNWSGTNKTTSKMLVLEIVPHEGFAK